MLIDIITAFPGLLRSSFGESMVRRGIEKGLVSIKINDLRDYSDDKHRRVDDSPYGGGPGMIMKPEPFFKAVRAVQSDTGSVKSRVILMSPQGALLTQDKLRELSGFEHLIVLCGHYEGVDDRVRSFLAQEEISIGDYVLTGGEIPAMVLVDAIVRLIPGVLSEPSLDEESFSNGLLEYPQYTRPQEYEGMGVPEVLLSGNHEKIKQWRNEESKKRTLNNRPELFHKKCISVDEDEFADK
ncbi:MAG: tRNA (guanosine(37)-N1)-methyltransferase TrmD [Bacillota bacterium]|nr:tRNA (guanosine(37)-N1)-methyltransferase TrmD [Bacillota bacterium]